MTRSRRNILITLFASAVLAFSFVFCQLAFSHHDTPTVIGVELGAHGQLKHRIVFEGGYRVIGWLPDIEGGHKVRIKNSHFFLETPGEPRQELKFLPQVIPDSMVRTDFCLPVENSSLWIAAGFYGPGNINVVVFGKNGVRTNRQITVAPNEWHPGHAFWFENGNRALRFRSTSGVGTYDVVSDDLKQNSQE